MGKMNKVSFMKFGRLFYPIVFIIGTITLFPLVSRCEFPGYSNTGVRTLEMVTQFSQEIASGTHTVRMTSSNSNIVDGTKHFWTRRLIDVQNGNSVSFIYPGTDRPDWSTMPMRVYYHNKDNLYTRIDHEAKRVYIGELNSSQLSGSNFLFAGRIHAGNLLSDLIKEASEQNRIVVDGDSRTLKIGAPYFNPPTYTQPLTFHLDDRLRVVKIEEPSKVFTFEWSETYPEGYGYVSHAIMESEGNRIKLHVDEWVREFKIDPPLSGEDFKVNYPESYSVFDTRNLLQVPPIKQ